MALAADLRSVSVRVMCGGCSHERVDRARARALGVAWEDGEV